MNSKLIALAGATVVASVGVASAATFDFQFNSNGNYFINGGAHPHVNVFETVTTPGADSSTLPVKDLFYSYHQPTFTGNADNIPFGGGIVRLMNGSSIRFAFDGTEAADGQSLEANLVSFFDGTGSLAGYAGSGNFTAITGSSVLAGDPNGAQSDYSLTSLSAQLQSVPEPTSMGALAIGIGAMLRRKVKSQ